MITNNIEPRRHLGLASLDLQPAQPIKSVYNSEDKGFLAAIKKAVNSCKSFFGLTANHKYTPIIEMDHSAKNVSLKPLEDKQPAAKYLNAEQLESMGQRVDLQHRAKTIEKQNTQAINEYVGMSYQEKLEYQQLNEIGTAILSHLDYPKEVGVFRTGGTDSQARLILEHLNKGLPLNHNFITENNVTIRDLTAAYKKLTSSLLPQTSSETLTLSTRFTNFADSQKNKLEVEGSLKTAPQLDSKTNAILRNTDQRIANTLPQLKQQPLSLQIAIPLFTEIAKNSDSNQMTAGKLAISFAPSLDRTDFSNIKVTNAKEMKALTQPPIDYVTALIERELSRH